MIRVAARVVVTVALGVGVAEGCGAAASLRSRDVTDAGSDATSPPSADAKAETSPPDPIRPAGLDPGWTLERRVDPACALYVPDRSAPLPPPLAWTDCEPSDGGIQCRRLSAPDGSDGPPYVDAAFSSAGRTLISAYETAQPLPGDYWIVADAADGSIQNAVYEADPFSCELDLASLFASWFTVRVFANTTSGVFFAGEIGSLAPRLAIPVTDGVHAPFATTFGPVDLQSGYQILQYRWDDGGLEGQLWSPAQDNGLQQGPFAPSTDATFWSADDLDYAKVNVYRPDGGVRAFLSAGLVIDHGYDNLGTDGHDLVWIEAKGRQTGHTTPYDTYDIMTSPYTSDPAQLQPRRVRSAVRPAFGGETFIVGCGYAAASDGSDVRVVRLADGMSWLLNTGPNIFGRPYALTCRELFVDIGVTGTKGTPLTTVARVSLDSLGAGIAPD